MLLSTTYEVMTDAMTDASHFMVMLSWSKLEQRLQGIVGEYHCKTASRVINYPAFVGFDTHHVETAA